MTLNLFESIFKFKFLKMNDSINGAIKSAQHKTAYSGEDASKVNKNIYLFVHKQLDNILIVEEFDKYGNFVNRIPGIKNLGGNGSPKMLINNKLQSVGDFEIKRKIGSNFTDEFVTATVYEISGELDTDLFLKKHPVINKARWLSISEVLSLKNISQLTTTVVNFLKNESRKKSRI